MERSAGSFCRQCGREMLSMAEIAGRGSEPGLRIWECTDCGATASDLVYPSMRTAGDDSRVDAL